MKKNLFLLGLLTFVMSISFVSCGSDDEPQVNPNETDVTAANLDYNASNAAGWGNYMQKVAELLVEDATTLYNDWTVSYNGGESYAQSFINHTGSNGYSSAMNCIDEIIEGCKTIANEVGSAKIGDPYTLYISGRTIDALYAVESWYSWHSIDDYSNNIVSIRNAYFGSRDGSPATASIATLVASKNASLDTEVRNKIRAAWNAIQSIPAPFRSHINSTEAKAAAEACADLYDCLNENLKPYLNSNVANGTITEAELQPIVENYVNVVVVPTYKELVEKNQALLEAVKAFRLSPSNSAFQACATAWLAARVPWETSEAFLFGPVADKGLDPNMDSWPLDQKGITDIIKSGNFDALNWSGEYEEEAEEGPSSQHATDIANAQSLRGFHTLEFLIFKDGKARTVN
ncbi:MAG: peptidase M75 [Bacteroidaceae bacterium]|nr:peptidase M75 [Bacteroidaceae bacterium]